MKELQVEKRDGETENFAITKIVGSLLFAGATTDQARVIAKIVEKWTRNKAGNNPIKTTVIRDKILELLKAENPDAAGSFEAYKK